VYGWAFGLLENFGSDILGFQKYYSKLARQKKNPKIRFRVRVYPNNPNQNHPVQYATARA